MLRRELFNYKLYQGTGCFGHCSRIAETIACPPEGVRYIDEDRQTGSESPLSNRCASTQLALDPALPRVRGFDNLEVCEEARQKKCVASLFDFAAPLGAQRIRACARKP